MAETLYETIRIALDPYTKDSKAISITMDAVNDYYKDLFDLRKKMQKIQTCVKVLGELVKEE